MLLVDLGQHRLVARTEALGPLVGQVDHLDGILELGARHVSLLRVTDRQVAQRVQPDALLVGRRRVEHPLVVVDRELRRVVHVAEVTKHDEQRLERHGHVPVQVALLLAHRVRVHHGPADALVERGRDEVAGVGGGDELREVLGLGREADGHHLLVGRVDVHLVAVEVGREVLLLELAIDGQPARRLGRVERVAVERAHGVELGRGRRRERVAGRRDADGVGRRREDLSALDTGRTLHVGHAQLHLKAQRARVVHLDDRNAHGDGVQLAVLHVAVCVLERGELLDRSGGQRERQRRLHGARQRGQVGVPVLHGGRCGEGQREEESGAGELVVGGPLDRVALVPRTVEARRREHDVLVVQLVDGGRAGQRVHLGAQRLRVLQRVDQEVGGRDVEVLDRRAVAVEPAEHRRRVHELLADRGLIGERHLAHHVHDLLSRPGHRGVGAVRDAEGELVLWLARNRGCGAGPIFILSIVVVVVVVGE